MTLIERARASQWALIPFAGAPGGPILCVQLDKDRWLRADADASSKPIWPMPEIDGAFTLVPMPDAKTLARSMTELSDEEMARLETFCAEPRNMDEIEDEFPVTAYWLRRAGILRDEGRKGRKIACVWNGLDLEQLIEVVYDKADLEA